jgi:NitT/TauT family transport system substrate-binding protein
MIMRSVALAAVALGLTVQAPAPAQAQDRVVFGTNWRAQAEHGGYYQAVATGLYKQYGLDVEIRQGGPSVNHSQLLAAGRIDFNMGGNLFDSWNYVKEGVPMVTIAAIFQKDPSVIITHPGQGHDSLAALKGKPILISPGARETYWQWLKAAFGYTDDQIRPYTFNMGPFLADKRMSQQGFATSEPYAIEKEGRIKPVVFLLADYGYATYSTTIETSWKLVREKPDLVQRFVDATIKGWHGYINGDPAPANALIKKANPDMTDDQIAFSIKAMREYGIVDSGDSKTLGIGAMTDQRIKSFFDFAVKAGLYPATLDYKSSYTLQFVNKKVGM